MKKALVVGINNYPSAPLQGCINDATAFRDLIEKNADDSANFNVLLSTDVSRSKLRGLLKELFSGANETALFYFSGHGLINELGGYLVTTDHRKNDEGISMNEILTLANRSESRNKVIILDCCHSAAITAPLLEPGNTGHINEGVTILTASKQDEAAVEVNGRGIFTNLLLEALKGGAADLNGNITPGSVYAYIDQALGPWDQRPVFKTNVSSFTTLRKIVPKLRPSILKEIISLFPEPEAAYQLDPSYEYSNHPEQEPMHKEPYATESNTILFESLQKMHTAGLVEPVGEEHMYWAAMNTKSCKLTPLGLHYWRLVQEKKI